MSKAYKNNIGPAGLPVGIEAFMDEIESIPDAYPESLNTVDRISTDEIASLSEEKRTIEEKIAVLKEKIQIQRNLKDAEDSPLMEIALHRFKAYGDPSGLTEIANRQQTRDMSKLQKDEADAAAMKDKENTLSRLNIIAKNAKDTLDNAKRSKGENSDEYRSALANYNLARYDVINAAKGLNDEEQVKRYSDAYPELSSNTSEGDSLVNIVDEYKALSTDKEKSAAERDNKLHEKGKPEGMSDAEWVTLRKELNANLKEAYDEEKKKYGNYLWHVKNKKLYDGLKATTDRSKQREIMEELKERKVPKLKDGKYPPFKSYEKPTEPKYL